MFKKICSLMLVTVLACGTFGSVALAKNSADSVYSFGINTNYPIRRTEARAKEDTSSTYVNLTRVPATYIYCDVEGYMPIGYVGEMRWEAKTLNGTVRIGTGKWLIRQQVYEHGGRSARLRFQRYDADGTVSGYWSPDSQGSYTYAN